MFEVNSGPLPSPTKAGRKRGEALGLLREAIKTLELGQWFPVNYDYIHTAAVYAETGAASFYLDRKIRVRTMQAGGPIIIREA